MKITIDIEKFKEGGLSPLGPQYDVGMVCNVCNASPAKWVYEPGGACSVFCEAHNPVSEDEVVESSDSGSSNAMANKIMNAYLEVAQPLLKVAANITAQTVDVGFMKMTEVSKVVVLDTPGVNDEQPE